MIWIPITVAMPLHQLVIYLYDTETNLFTRSGRSNRAKVGDKRDGKQNAAVSWFTLGGLHNKHYRRSHLKIRDTVQA